MRLGIIGCGRIMLNGHVPAFKQLGERIEVAAAADPSEERRKVIAEALGLDAAHLYPDYEQMLDREDLDLVDIATPHFLHRDPAVAAANAKVNVITEKPLARNLAEADDMITACQDNGVRLAVLHNYRFLPAVKRLLEVAKSGAIGEIFMCRMGGMGRGYYQGVAEYDPSWRADERGGGGCLIDNGYHWVYIFREVMKSPLTSVYARTGTFSLPIKVEDLAAVLYGHENGGIFSLQTGWSVKAGGQSVLEAYGKEGAISMSRFDGKLAVYSNKTGEWRFPQVEPKAPGGGFPASFAEIIDAFENDKELIPDGAEARRNLEAVEMAYRSAESNEAVGVMIPPPGT